MSGLNEEGGQAAARSAQLSGLLALQDGNPVARLRALRASIAGRVVFTTSFGLEDQAIAHMIFEGKIDIDVVTLDTGRLMPSTYKVWADTEMRYGRRIRSFHPNADRLAAHIGDAGVNGFYFSKEARIDCCFVRKVEPLGRALDGAGAWVVGLRADQSQRRGDITLAQWDEAKQLVKFAPLHDWTRAQVAAFCDAESIPVNELHAQGFASIGCAPCTRAIAPGESERAGRWWWEDDAAKECGLHIGSDGKLMRASAP